MSFEETFSALRRRIDQIVTDPSGVRAPLTRLARPLFLLFRWQPKPRIEATRALWEELQRRRSGTQEETEAPPRDLQKLLQEALQELEANITSIERAYVINRRVPVAYAAWLHRLQEMLERVAPLLEEPESPELLRAAAGTSFVSLLPPLSIQPRGESQPASGQPEATSEPPPGEEGAASQEHNLRDAVNPERLLELELGAVDHLIEAAQEEPEVLARRRRLLEAARQLLLEVSAALPLETAGMRERQLYLAQEIARINRLEAAGVSTEVGLLHQARSALDRGDRQRLYTTLLALDRVALDRGDVETAARTGEILRRLHPDFEQHSLRAARHSMRASAEELLGEDIIHAIQNAYEKGRRSIPPVVPGLSPEDRYFFRAAREYLGEEGELATLMASLAVDGLFEVGGALSPLRVVEYERRRVAVRYPMQTMTFVPAQDVEDIPNAVIEDPRTILLSLAAGRLLTRRFLREEVVPRKRTVMQSEIRVYVLDGSLSMLGPRARMRDAILLAELVTLKRRLTQRERSTRVALFYRYFNEELGPTTRVDSIPGVMEAISDVISNVRRGGTNIQLALIASFEQIREARRSDPDLARAQIVLVTDGEAPVDEEALHEAREGLGDLPIGVSVIALGEENHALRALVARQRAQGERAFYHFIDDEALARYCNGQLDDGPVLHLPHPQTPPRTQQAEREELASLVGGLLDELATLGRTRDLEALERLDAEAQARRELGLAEDSLSEGERARIEALHRDRRALGIRFARWFPAPAPTLNQTPLPRPGTRERDDLEAVMVLLATVAEVIGVVGGSDLARQSDAIDVLERLMVDAHLSPARYEEILAAYPAHVAAGLQAIHELARKSDREQQRGPSSSFG